MVAALLTDGQLLTSVPGRLGVGHRGLYLLRATRSRVVVTYGGLGRSPGCDGFRVDFGSVKEIVSGARLSSRPG
jgi:hypothetical protein